ncbi:chloramphenicol acetyltransferase [Prevotella sp. PINT]|jgi:Chloramphenicol O-acetyltransferase|uniref:chloramphenicol acetyltransferase n=1 Tax=Palleniella intestinalis TaxID=2736291 RepID=UPI0015554093|nr:chloramphenicol acetyltransferase [Palleniella intestinalis]NPD82156.1 chloramphenicol acetyltransferase [Palleniella intestinalis]
MKQFVDLEKWNRREHFEFFSSFDDPFFGVTTLVDFTNVRKRCKAEQKSFFLYSVHFLLRCINETEAFKLRIEDGNVVKYDTVHVSPTIGRDDGTFGFGFFEYNPDFAVFAQNADKEVERVKNSSGLAFSDNTGREDLIRYSALPWFAFSEMKHAVSFGRGDSVPRISTGKLITENGKHLLPVSVSVNHALMDGRDVAELIEKLEAASR